MAKPSSIQRSASTLEVTRSELRVGPHAHHVHARSGPSASDGELLDAYLDFVRTMRNSNGIVWLRNEDLDVLSQVIGRSTDAIRADLEGRMTVQRVETSRARSKRRRLAFAAFGVAVVGSTLVIAGPGRATISSSAAPRIGSAVTITRVADVAIGDAQTITRVDGALVEVNAAGISDSDTQVGDAQTITRN
jgi:hypothetical protein